MVYLLKRRFPLKISKIFNYTSVSHSSHHLKAYIVFLVASLLLVGVLAYLYTPFTLEVPHINSQALVMSAEEYVSSEVIFTEEIGPSTAEAKRIRMTTLLLRYQKDLSELESQTPSSDIVAKIQLLRHKIEKLENMIKSLTQ